MSDETAPAETPAPPPAEGEMPAPAGDGAPTADDQGSAAPVVPTDPSAESEQAGGVDLEAKVAELEQAVTERDALLAEAAERIEHLEGQVAELEADPYRSPAPQGATQFDIPSVAAHEEQDYQGRVEGWERTYGDTPVQPDADHVEV